MYKKLSGNTFWRIMKTMNEGIFGFWLIFKHRKKTSVCTKKKRWTNHSILHFFKVNAFLQSIRGHVSSFSSRRSTLLPQLIIFSKLTDQKIIRTRSTKRIYRSATAGKLGPKMDQKLTWHLYFPVQNGERKFRFAWVNEGKKICKFAKDREISLAKKKDFFHHH